MSDQAPGGAATGGATIQGVGADLSSGSIVGEYRIQRVLGRGGMGVVYAALQPVIEKRVAIKVLSAQFSATPELVRRFIDEARAVNRIGHENIIDIFSFGQLPDGRQYFVMEYLEGATLAERLEHGDIPAAELPGILIQICDALDAAHAKMIVHRDLKPENVWIGVATRGGPRVRLLDFGIAKLLDTGDRMVTDVGAVMGTPHFMSPEQCNGRGVDHRTDIYAMGVIMYRVFAGRLPILGETYAEILGKQLMEMPPPPSSLATLPAALDQLIMRCLAKEPRRRPQTAGELAAALGSIFGVVTFQPRASAELWSPEPSGPATVGLSAAPTELPTLPPAPAQGPAPAKGGRGAVLILGVVGLALVAVTVTWFVTRGASSTDAVSHRAPAPAARLALPPVPPSAPAAAPAVAPPSTAAAEPKPTSASTKHRPAGEAKIGEAKIGEAKTGEAKTGEAKTGVKPTGKSGPSRASSSGLVTENPFE